MKTKDKLLESYYKGETSLEEELQIKELVLQEDVDSAEKMAFDWYQHEGSVPADLEDTILERIKQKEQKKNSRRMWIYSFTSAAASILLVVGLFLGIRAERYQKMEDDFFVMEQALYQVSESLQPQEQEEMLVLWVDKDVEIIIK